MKIERKKTVPTTTRQNCDVIHTHSIILQINKFACIHDMKC